MPAVKMNVALLDGPSDPIRTIYLAFRTCYSSLAPQTMLRQMQPDNGAEPAISREKMLAFVADKLRLAHSTPRTHCHWTFAVSGVSRTATHQLNRHQIGVRVDGDELALDQQSQRYVMNKMRDDGSVSYVLPESVEEPPSAPLGEPSLREQFEDHMKAASQLYARLLDAGIPSEDARFVLPQAVASNFIITLSFEALLHIGQQRLCTRAQWEVRHLLAKMRRELRQRHPELAVFLQPKCGELQGGVCDEAEASWRACPVGRIRPHISQANRLRGWGAEAEALTESEYRVIEESV